MTNSQLTDLRTLILSEVGDFFAVFGSPGEPETPEEMQRELSMRLGRILNNHIVNYPRCEVLVEILRECRTARDEAQAELQERRKADSEPAMYVMGMGQALDAETASTCKGAVDSWVAEWNQSRLPGQADYKTVPLYRHAQPAVDSEFIPKNLDKALGVLGVAIPESREEFNFQTERWIQRLIDRVIRYADEFQEQPAPAVPDERSAFNAWNNEDNLPIAGVCAKNAAWLAWQARASLCGNSVLDVPPERPADSSNGDDVEAWFDEGWNACRAAMLQAEPVTTANKLSNSPVIPDGLIAAVNRLLDSDGSRGCYSAIQCGDAHDEIERLLAAALQEEKTERKK